MAKSQNVVKKNGNQAKKSPAKPVRENKIVKKEPIMAPAVKAGKINKKQVIPAKKQKVITPAKLEPIENDDDDDDDDNDDVDDQSEMDTTGASVNSSIAEEDEDDEDDDEEDEDDMDEDEDEDEEEEEEEEEDEDEEEEKNVKEEKNDSSKKVKKTESEQDTKSAKKTAPAKVMLSPEEKAEVDSRTIFIGNVPIAVDEKKIRATFKSFGPIESIRMRGLIPEKPNTPLKVAAIKKQFHKKATTKCVFVVYKSKDSANKALSLNGQILEGNYLRVDLSGCSTKMDPKKAIFVGNMKYDVEDNDLWTTFQKCGKINSVRTVRDRKTGLCRGIAYINFESEDSVALALNLNGQKLRNREMRVGNIKEGTKKAKTSGQKRAHPGKGDSSPAKKAKKAVEGATNIKNAERRVIQKTKRSQGEKKRAQDAGAKPQESPKANKTFQGQKSNVNKKAKKGGSTFEKKKQKVAAKLMAKPKKNVN